MKVKTNYNYLAYGFIPKTLRIILAIIPVLWIPFVTVLIAKNNCSNEIIIFAVSSTIVFLLLVILSGRYGIVILEDKIVIYEIRKKVFKNELIESVKLDEFGSILIKYENKIYKFRGRISLITQDSSNKKNQELVDIILKKINKEYSTDALLDDENNVNLF